MEKSIFEMASNIKCELCLSKKSAQFKSFFVKKRLLHIYGFYFHNSFASSLLSLLAAISMVRVSVPEAGETLARLFRGECIARCRKCLLDKHGVAAMRAYISSGAHRRVMPKLKDWCDEAYVAHWEQESTALPDWTEAHRQMKENGRRSKVNNPSPAHLEFEIPKPKA